MKRLSQVDVTVGSENVTDDGGAMIIKQKSKKATKLQFEIKDTKTQVFQAEVPKNIEAGQRFTFQFGDGHYVEQRSEEAIWVGERGVKGWKDGDLERSIKATVAYQALTKSSQAFYDALAERFCGCTCNVPVVADFGEKRVLGVDLETPDYPRNSSRYIVFVGDCDNCGKPLTWGSSCDSFCAIGVDAIKTKAEADTGRSIAWGSVITTIKGAEQS